MTIWQKIKDWFYYTPETPRTEATEYNQLDNLNVTRTPWVDRVKQQGQERVR